MSAYLSRDEILGLSAQEIQDYLARGWIDEADVAAWQEWQQSSLEPNDPRLAQAEINTFLDTRDRYDMGEFKSSPKPPASLADILLATGSAFGDYSVAGGGRTIGGTIAALGESPVSVGFNPIEALTSAIETGEMRSPSMAEEGRLFADQRGRRRSAQETLTEAGVDPNSFLGAVAQSGESVFPMLAARLAGNPAAATAVMAGSIVGPEYIEGTDEMGLSGPQAFQRAAALGGTELLTERLGMGALMKGGLDSILGKQAARILEKNYGTKVLGAAAANVAEELAATETGMAIDESFGRTLTPEEKAQQRFAAAVGGGVLGGGIRAVTALGERSPRVPPEVQPTGDPAFDAGQLEGKRELDQADRDIPPPSSTTRIPEQQDLFGPPVENLGSFEEQEAARRKELEIDAGLSIGRKQTKPEDTDTKIVSTLETNIDRKRQTVEALQERIEAGDTSSATFNTMTKAVKEMQAAEKALDGFKQSRLKKEEQQTKTTEVKRPQLSEPVQGALNLQSEDDKKIASLVSSTKSTTEKVKTQKEKEEAKVKDQQAKKETKILELKSKQENSFLAERTKLYKDQGLDNDQIKANLYSDLNTFRNNWVPPKDVEVGASAPKTTNKKPLKRPQLTPAKPATPGIESLDLDELETQVKQQPGAVQSVSVLPARAVKGPDDGIINFEDVAGDSTLDVELVAPKVEGQIEKNRSGETNVSKEALSRFEEEKSKGMMRAVLKPNGEIIPLTNPTDVDYFPQKGDMTVQRDADGNWKPLDYGTVPKTIGDVRIRQKVAELDPLADEMGFKRPTVKPVAVKAPVTRGIPLVAKPDGNTEISDTLRTGGATVDVLLDKIEKNTTDGLNKTIANRLKSLGLKNTVRVIPSKDIPSDVKTQVGEGAKAYYYKGEIVVTEEALADSESDVAWYVQHEATHAASEEVMGRDDKDLTRQQVKAKGDVVSLFEQVKATPELAGEYGINSPSEFLAEAHSNKAFQDKLNQIKVKGSPRTLWSKFVETVRNLLGLSKSQDTALSEIIRLGEAVMEAQQVRLPRKKATSAPAPSPVSQQTAPLNVDMVNTPTQLAIGTSERTGMTAAIRKLAVNIGRAGGDINPRLREIKETVYGGQEQAGGIEALTMKNRLQDLINQEGDPSLSKNINAAFKDSENAIPKLNQLLQGKSPALVQEINQIIRDIKLDGITILREIKKTGTDIDPAVLNKIYRSATDPNYLYTTRSYIINAPRKAGEKYARKVLRAGGLYSRMYFPDVVANAIEGAIAKFSPVHLGMKKEYARRVNAAVDFFLRNDLYIPTEKKDLYRMKTDRIKALHEAHFNKKSYFNKDLAKEYGLDPKDKKAIKKALIDELAVRAKDQTVAEYQEKMKTRAEQMVRDMLKVTDPLTMSKLSKFYAGDRADLTIVTGRENVPKEIRELWGEYEDATFNLFNTRWRQKEFIAKQQMLNEVAGLQGELLFDEPTGIHTDRLTGKTWGPLEGKYVSPDTKYYLDATQEATESISGIVRDIIINKNLSNFGQRFFASLNSSYTLPLSSTAKLFTVAGNAAGVVMNFAGSPIIAIRDGNFDPKTYAQALKVSKDLIGIVNKKGTYGDALEIIRLGLQDSVQTGEISDSEVRSILEATATEGLWADLTKKGHAARMTMVDVFSYSDAWAKIANYYNQKNLLTKVYKEAGVNVPEETIKREAAERTKRTNLSYLRAPLMAKVPEKTGLLWFTTYTWETFRSTLAGVKMVKDDAARVKQLRAAGKTEAANTLAKANAKRAAGLSVAVPASGMLIQTAVDLSISLAQAVGILPAPEDEEDKEKMEFIAEQASYAGTPGALMTPVSKNKDGSMSFFDAARLDPIGPINEMLRGLTRIASGDATTSTAFDTLSNLAIENSFLVNHVVGNYALLTGKPVSPGGAAYTFDKGWQQYKAGAINAFNGLEDKQLDAAYRAWNQVMFPKTALTGAMATAEALSPNPPDRPVALQVAAGLGLNVINYDPRESVKKSAQFDFRNEVGPALSDLQNYFGYDYQNINLNVVEERVLEIAEQEFDSWQRVRDKVTAAQYAGVPDGEIAKSLKDSRAMNQFQIASVMSGKFVPYIVSPDNIRSWMQAELNSNPNDQKAIQEKYMNLSPALMGLAQKYRTMFTHKE